MKIQKLNKLINLYIKQMNEKKNNDILTISSKNGYPESRNLESSAQRGKSLIYIIIKN